MVSSKQMQMNQPVFSVVEAKPAVKRNSNTKKKVLVIVGVVILLITLSSASYFLGTKSEFGNGLAPTPTPGDVLTKPLFEIPTDTPTPTVATATNSAQPTGKSTPSPTPTPKIKSKIISSEEGLDGFRTSDDKGSNSLEIRIGRNENAVTRGFVSFNISELPAGIEIQEAELKLYQTKVVGNPYAVGSVLKVDHLTYGDALDATDYSAPALVGNIATLATTNKTVGWKQAIVTEAVENDVANARSLSQFRIHFTAEIAGGDLAGDIAYFDSANNYYDHTDHPPQLIIKYY
ncbi:DNRLRE domain-containing protein [Patescibacteria group bacterium]|nr:DNRLRE domain-containing protein [Patescibacteria group bacterium]